MSARERILARVRGALEEKERAPHPGAFRGPRPEPLDGDPVEGFCTLFRRAGGEVVRVADEPAAVAWVGDFSTTFGSVAVGATLPPPLVPASRPSAPPESAELGISMALGAVAETGSLLLDSADGRRTQLLPPTHLVVVRAPSIHPTLAGALASVRSTLPATLGLHSGPSKSADIGQVLVRGVHGPGRVVALVIEA
ncbi:MAG TPA: LUD domain-containing protein [Longimicrobiales bacterium]|nr:LUD domain-containing protein [Longimicrobiales bacterium]